MNKLFIPEYLRKECYNYVTITHIYNRLVDGGYISDFKMYDLPYIKNEKGKRKVKIEDIFDENGVELPDIYLLALALDDSQCFNLIRTTLRRNPSIDDIKMLYDNIKDSDRLPRRDFGKVKTKKIKDALYQVINQSKPKTDAEQEYSVRIRIESWMSTNREKLEKQLNKYIEETGLKSSDIYDISLMPVGREESGNPYVIEPVIMYQLSITHKEV